MIVNRPEGDKLTGFYLGRVVAHLPDGKYKVFIPGVYADKYKVMADYLPPAVLANDAYAAGASGDGVISYVNIGTVVYCFFANGDQNCPIIFATATGGRDFSNVQNYKEFSSLFVDEGCSLDYKNQDPVTIVKSGKTMIKQNAGGQLQILAERNMTNSVDPVHGTYSHSMHMFNTMKSQGRVQDNNYLVFSNKPDDVLNSEIRYRKLSNTNTDGDSEWFLDNFNDDDEEGFECIGISCVISPQSDEAYLVGAKIDCPKAGIQNQPSWNRQLYSSWGGQSHEPPCIVRGGTTKNVYINCDGSRKFVEFASKNGADLYICNGEQYGFMPQYWDKHFQGGYPSMCPQKVIPPPVLADAGAFNINIYLLDPYKVTSSQTVSEDGSITLSVHDMKYEYEKIQRDAGDGTISSYEFLQDGEYGGHARLINDYWQRSKAEDIRGLSSFEIERRYGYISATDLMETVEISSIKSLSSEITKQENLTASWANPDSVTRASYEGGDRSDIDISNYSNIHSFERYMSPDDTSSHISSIEYFTRNEHCPIRGIITSYMSTMLSVDLNDGSREDRIMSVWNVPEDTLKHWNGYRDTISTETRLLSSWRNPTSDNTEDSLSGYQMAKPRSVQDITVLSSLDKNAGSDNSVKLSCETGTSFTNGLCRMASKVTQGGGGNSATTTDLAEETRSTQLGEVKRDYLFESSTVVEKDGFQTKTTDKLEKKIDVKLGGVSCNKTAECKTDATLDNDVRNVNVRTGDVREDYTLKTTADGSLIAQIESKENVSASAAIVKKTVNDAKGQTETLEEFDAKNGKITISIKGQDGNVTVTLDNKGNISITGTTHLNVSIGGQSTLDMDKSGSVKIVSPNNDVKIEGNTDIKGTLHVSGQIDGDVDIVAGKDCKASNCTLNTHVHTYAWGHDPGSADTAPGH